MCAHLCERKGSSEQVCVCVWSTGARKEMLQRCAFAENITRWRGACAQGLVERYAMLKHD